MSHHHLVAQGTLVECLNEAVVFRDSVLDFQVSLLFDRVSAPERI